MQRTALVILFGLLSAPHVQGVLVSTSELEFRMPGNLEGAWQAEGADGLLLLADPNHVVEIELHVEKATLFNQTTTAAHLEKDGIGAVDPETAPRTSSRDLGTGLVRLRIGEYGPASFYFEGEFTKSSTTGPARLEGLRPGATLSQFGPDYSGYRFIVQRHPAAESEVMVYAGELNDVDATSDHVSFAEWTNAVATCSGTRACPGGARPSAVAPSPLSPRPAVEERSFESVQPNGAVIIRGDPLYLAFSGPSLDLRVDGRVRLPLASGTACEGCVLPDGQTLSVSGQVELTRIQPEGANHMRASLSGDIVEARFDEQSISPQLLGQAGVAVGVVAAAGTLVVIFKLLGGAFLTRLRGDPLEHPKRAKIMAYIKDHPGATFREVAKQTETATGTARHHLSMMKRHDLIVEHPHGATMRFFENHGKFDLTWSRVVLLREEPLKQLHDWLAGRPEAPQKDVLEAMEALHGWSRSTTQHRLARLSEGGLVTVRLQGRLKFYALRPSATSRPTAALTLATLPAT